MFITVIYNLQIFLLRLGSPLIFADNNKFLGSLKWGKLPVVGYIMPKHFRFPFFLISSQKETLNVLTQRSSMSIVVISFVVNTMSIYSHAVKLSLQSAKLPLIPTFFLPLIFPNCSVLSKESKYKILLDLLIVTKLPLCSRTVLPFMLLHEYFPITPQQ